MQKQEIVYLVLQSTYEQVEVALFKEQIQIDLIVVPKFVASGQLIPALDDLLTKNNHRLENLSFIGANLGPAPFTTLRTVISTINGIRFATQIPLVGINGITTLVQEHSGSNPVIAILNAFGDSLYYAIKTDDGIKFGWKMAKIFWEQVAQEFANQTVQVVGEGISNLKDWGITLPSNFEINATGPKFTTLKAVAANCLIAYQDGHSVNELQPLYLKSAIPASFQNRSDRS